MSDSNKKLLLFFKHLLAVLIAVGLYPDDYGHAFTMYFGLTCIFTRDMLFSLRLPSIIPCACGLLASFIFWKLEWPLYLALFWGGGISLVFSGIIRKLQLGGWRCLLRPSDGVAAVVFLILVWVNFDLSPSMTAVIVISLFLLPSLIIMANQSKDSDAGAYTTPESSPPARIRPQPNGRTTDPLEESRHKALRGLASDLKHQASSCPKNIQKTWL